MNTENKIAEAAAEGLAGIVRLHAAQIVSDDNEQVGVGIAILAKVAKRLINSATEDPFEKLALVSVLQSCVAGELSKN